MNNNCIIFFVKYPEKGKIKTRLAIDLDDDFVINIYKCFVTDILSVLNRSGYDFKVYFNPPGFLNKIKKWLGDNYTYARQQGNDLGERMCNAFEEVFRKNYDKAVIIGSDMPCFSHDFFSRVFKKLDHNDVVIGPSPDGGYYLLGFKKGTFLKEIFGNMQWSTETVFDSTIKKIQKNKYKMNILETMNDIDTINDLKIFTDENKKSEFKNSNTMKYILKSKIF